MKTLDRPEVLNGYTSRIPTPCGSLYLTLNENNDKLCEIRATLGKCGSCMNIMLQTIALLISVMLQSNISREKIQKTLENQFEGGCGNIIRYKGEEYNSCIDYIIRKVLEDMGARGEITLEK
jgi:ribonucleoside-diphosphate reductase alpha chain